MEVTNCFCVPHKEYEDHVEAELQYAQDMFELNKKVRLVLLLCLDISTVDQNASKFTG